MTNQHGTVHTSVLLHETVSQIDPKAGDCILDATLGGGGHTEALLSVPQVSVVALDADDAALERAKIRLARFAGRVRYIHGNFADAPELLKAAGITSVSHAVFDLGFSSDQLARGGRGFSFAGEEPLHMGYDKTPRLGITAAELLATWGEDDIANVIFGYGEERYARRIAKAIVIRRRSSPITTTKDLVEVIRGSVPKGYLHGRINPATKTFQALRIAVNDELSVIKDGLRGGAMLVAPGGRIAVISFHSIEDRTVKQTLKELAEEELISIRTKKPIAPTRREVADNPRARSAKLRVAQRL